MRVSRLGVPDSHRNSIVIEGAGWSYKHNAGMHQQTASINMPQAAAEYNCFVDDLHREELRYQPLGFKSE
jgi:hypothetical protein